ncbi:hypothetical protein [Propionivibrio sp.]|uniref:hypothetical protein n=1 Tax=Propionivibrio sp. TaxID=2212460 RepID=UPI003BF3F713
MLRNITITPVLNGFVAQVGCQQLAYTSVDKLVLDVGAYLRDPEATEKRILKEEGFNAKHTLGGAEAPAPYPQVNAATDCCAGEPQPTTATGVGAMLGGLARR